MAITIFFSVFTTLLIILNSVVIFYLVRNNRVLSETSMNLAESNKIIDAFYQQQERAMMVMGEEEPAQIGLQG